MMNSEILKRLNVKLKIKLKIKKILFFSMISCYINFCYADVNSDLQGFFNGLDYSSNTTSPHAVQGQEAGFYSGGSLFVRSRSRQLELAHIDTPSIRSGCGGIDLYAGGASFINSQQLTQFGKSILQSAPSVALQIAMETYAPQLAKVMTTAQEWAQQINSFNMSSCEGATALVAGVWPKNTAGNRYLCQDIGTQSNQFSDWLSARVGCQSDHANQVFDQGNQDSKYQNQLPINKNIVWTALQHNGFLQNDRLLAEFFMTLSGTVVFDKEGQPTLYPAKVTDKAVLNALLQGGQATIYRCNDAKACLNLSTQTVTVDANAALTQKVAALLLQLSNQFQSDTPLTNDERGFLEYTSYPVLKFISLEYESNRRPDMAEFADAISEDLLAQYLIAISQLIRDTLMQTTSYNEAATQPIFNNITQGLQFLATLQAESNRRMATMTQVIENYMQIEKRVIGHFSAKTQANYSFGE